MKKETHGGQRANSGRRLKNKDGPRKTVSVCLSPANAAYLATMGKQKNDYLNLLLERERKG